MTILLDTSKPLPSDAPGILSRSRAIVERILSNARNVNASSVERVRFVSGVLERSRELRDTVAEMDNGVSEATRNVTTIRTDVSRTHDIFGSIQSALEISSGEVSNVSETTKSFHEEFANLKSTTDRISKLSQEIRLLSVNAGVEAARAGQYGVGFTVVADQVRYLAESSAADLAKVDQQVKLLEKHLDSMMERVASVEAALHSNLDLANSGCEQASSISQRVEAMGAGIIVVSNALSNQLSRLTGFSDDINNIRANTEAAVEGSATNMGLCEEVLHLMREAGSR